MGKFAGIALGILIYTGLIFGLGCAAGYSAVVTGEQGSSEHNASPTATHTVAGDTSHG